MESWRGIERHRGKEIASVLSPSSMRYPRFRDLGLRDLCANGERSFSLEPLSLPPPSIFSDRQDWVEEISGSTQCFLSRRAGEQGSRGGDPDRDRPCARDCGEGHNALIGRSTLQANHEQRDVLACRVDRECLSRGDPAMEAFWLTALRKVVRCRPAGGDVGKETFWRSLLERSLEGSAMSTATKEGRKTPCQKRYAEAGWP